MKYFDQRHESKFQTRQQVPFQLVGMHVINPQSPGLLPRSCHRCPTRRSRHGVNVNQSSTRETVQQVDKSQAWVVAEAVVHKLSISVSCIRSLYAISVSLITNPSCTKEYAPTHCTGRFLNSSNIAFRLAAHLVCRKHVQKVGTRQFVRLASEMHLVHNTALCRWR